MAGDGPCWFGGDGGPATAAWVKPWGLAVDGNGALYISEPFRIRKVDAAGTIMTVAGNGSAGFSGDGGPATEANLWLAWDVAIDGPGNLFFPDWRNLRIRKVAATGTISTVAGTGTWGFSGDGGSALAARLAYPRGVGIDGAGSLLIADSSNNRVRKVTAAGIITTVAGRGYSGNPSDGISATTAMIREPVDVAADGAGNLYIVDEYSHRVRKVDPSGIITTVAGMFPGWGSNPGEGFTGDGGPATSARLASPYGVAVAPSGEVYIADTNNLRVRKVDTSGTISTLAGNGNVKHSGDGGPGTAARLSGVRGVAVDAAGNLYVADAGNVSIRKIDPTGKVTTLAGSRFRTCRPRLRICRWDRQGLRRTR